MLQKNQVLPLEITALSGDGNGVGRIDGQVVFVPATARGDVTEVRIVKVNKRFAYGRLERLVTPGPGRIVEDCPISRSCGGCQLRHLGYDVELAEKRGFVADALKRIGGFEQEPLPTLPSPQVDRYRNKVQYPVAPGPGGTPIYGFYAERSHRVVPCQDCLLHPAELNAMAKHAAELLAQYGAQPYDEQARTGLIRHIALRQGVSTGQVLLCLVATQPTLPWGDAFAQAMAAEWPRLKTVVLNHNPDNTNVIFGPHSAPLLGPGYIRDTLCGVPMRLTEHTFDQVNSGAATRLFGLAAEYAAPQPGQTLLDLYCGTGVIGLSMAARCAQLIGVEIIPAAVESARQSAAEMGLSNTRFLCADAGGAAKQLAAEGLSPDIIVLDPPRKGADRPTLDAMLAMAPARVVMVSCDAATAARDLRILCDGGYTLVRAQPADMFPRTRHVECLYLLERDRQ